MIVTEKKHREALALIAKLEERVSRAEALCKVLQSLHDKLATATGYVYLPRMEVGEYAHRNSDRAKRYMAELEAKWGKK